MAGDEIHASYLLDLGYILRERAEEAAREARSRRATDFARGRAMGYYEVISLMQNQAETFELPLEDLRLDGIDPEQDLF